MKTKLHFALLASALMLPAVVVSAAEEKEQPRPAQESRSGNTTGKESTKPSAETPATPARPAEAKEDSKPKPEAKEDSKQQPRPAQESRSGATTGRDATKSPEKTDKAADKAK